MRLKEDSANYKRKEEFLKFCEMESSRNISHEGYLVCDKCGGYYKLQNGESPEDFLDTCECGGKLGFHENINLEDGSGKSRKNLPADVATALVIIILCFAFQVVSYVLELVKLNSTGLMVTASLTLVLFLCLTFGTQRLLGFLGWNLLFPISKPKKVYMVCSNCRGYYELQTDESPEDFLDTCSCGGKLVSSSSPNLKESRIKVHTSLIPPLMCILSLLVLWFIFKFGVNLKISGYSYVNFLVVVMSQVLSVAIFRVLSLTLDPLGIEISFS